MSNLYTLENRRKIKAENYQKTIALFQSTNGNLTCREMGQQIGIQAHTVQQYLKEYFQTKKIFQ